MEKAIANSTPIYVDMLPTRDEFFTGVCLKANEEIFLLVTFDDSMGCYDGLTLLKNQEIGNFRYLEEEELAAIEINNWQGFVAGIPVGTINSFVDFYKWIKTSGKLISLFSEEYNEGFFVGKIQNVLKDSIEVKLIDEMGKWLHTEIISMNSIDSVSFDSHYETEILEKQDTKPSTNTTPQKPESTGNKTTNKSAPKSPPSSSGKGPQKPFKKPNPPKKK